MMSISVTPFVGLRDRSVVFDISPLKGASFEIDI